MRLNVAVKNGVGRSKPLTAERVVNMYAEKSPAGAIANVNLVGVDGLVTFASVGTGIRGMWKFADKLFVVSGGRLYQIDTDGSSTDVGAIAGSGLVMMADNGTQLCIVANPYGYIYTTADGLVEITDADFPGATSVAFLDGYFIFTDPDTQEFFISALYDGETYDALDFASAESAPDNLIRVFVDHREVWLFGTDSTEVWYNAGNADFPFARIEGALVERGLGAVASVAKVDNSIYWLDNVGIVRRADKGYAPTRISTHEIENAVSRGTMADCSALTYVKEGHEFYALTVPGVGTYVYDAATQAWHERSSQQGVWRVSSYVSCFGKHLFGDSTHGKVYELTGYVDAENELVAELVFPPIQADGDRFRLHSVELDMEAGVGGSTDPRVMLCTSKDGKTWSNEDWTGFGKLGEYENRALWTRLGQYNKCHLKFRISDPVKRAVYTAYASMTKDD